MALTEDEFLAFLQRRIANTSVGPSTVRGMGPRGTVEAARRHLVGVELRTFALASEQEFVERLDFETDRLMRKLPGEASRWGIARKLLNIFLRGATYNRFLCGAYDLPCAEPWLEVPLDSHVATGLREEDGGKALPPWRTVKDLDPVVSRQYQDFAAVVAKQKGIVRVHLDLLYWRRPERTGG
jgi:hypothetical protein